MHYDISVRRVKNTLLVSETISDYTLRIDTTWGKSFTAKSTYFEVPAFGSGFSGVVSCRDLERYGPPIEKAIAQARAEENYLEIGAGLGGFVEALLESGYEGVPTIIDPANYQVMRLLLSSALAHVEQGPLRERLAMLGARCDLYLSDRVTIESTTFEEALDRFAQFFDVVVENMGPCHWHRSLGYETLGEVIELERRFLREGGRLFVGLNNFGCRERN